MQTSSTLQTGSTEHRFLALADGHVLPVSLLFDFPRLDQGLLHVQGEGNHYRRQTRGGSGYGFSGFVDVVQWG